MIRIFKYKPKKRDRGRIFRLLKQLFPGRKLDRSILKDKHFIVAKKNGRIVGLATIKIKLWGLVAHVNEFVVARRLRSKGIGRRMLRRIVEMAKARSCKLIFLTSAPHRKRAHRFYEANRFKRIFNVLYRMV